jgi:signal transduction histidine kinase
MRARPVVVAPERAAYLLVSEVLTNGIKHSRASEARVSAVSAGGFLIVEVADTGIGGAGAGAGGSVLRGLADRVEAFGGRFGVSSPPGRGTTIRVEIPCA